MQRVALNMPPDRVVRAADSALSGQRLQLPVVGENADVTHLRQQHVKVGQRLFWFSQYLYGIDRLQR